MLLLLTVGLVLSVCTLAIPERAFVYIGKHCPWWSPSVTTGARVVIYWISLIVGYFVFSVFWGFLGVVEGCVLDVVDGLQARIYARHCIHRTARELGFGKYFDPLCDKGTVPPTLVYFGYLDTINLWLTVAIFAVDIVGTFMRHAKDIGAWLAKRGPRGKKVGTWLIAKHEKYTRLESATSIGKIKALMQCLTLIACMPCQQGWIHGVGFANAMGSFTLALGVFSIVSRLYVHRSFDGCVDWITEKFFSHIDFRASLRSLWQKA